MNGDELTQVLKDIFEQRRRRNAKYSLRAFARSLGMHSATLSLILTGKRKPSTKHVMTIIDRLGLEDHELGHRLLKSNVGLRKVAQPPEYKVLSAARFAPVRDWEHTAILAAFEINPQIDPALLARRLGIETERVKLAMRRLLEAGLLAKAERGFVPSLTHQTTEADAPNEDLRECHRQFIAKSLQSLERDPVDTREISGITITVDSERLPLAKKAIRDFQAQFVQLMEGRKADTVYRLNVQFYPLTRGRLV